VASTARRRSRVNKTASWWLLAIRGEGAYGRLAVVRLAADGTLDRSFGTRGKTAVNEVHSAYVDLADDRGGLDRELEQCAQRLAPMLLELAGCGPLSAAKLLCEIGPINRFRTDAQLARHAGVAPLDASSGKSQRHRLDRGGNRQLNCALHRIAVTQGRSHPPARAYLERKQAEGKTRREALRCLKRQLARTVYTTLKNEPPLT
jgi:transposase